MRLPVLRAMIDRRVLVNFRVDPEVLAEVCPTPFRPQVVNGYGIAGICLIRLANTRPEGLPAFVGVGSENAAHRIAVSWDTEDGVRSGVYVPRRDTSSTLNALAGGRVFPGVQHRAHFDVGEAGDDYYIAMDSIDGSTHVAVSGTITEDLPDESIFDSLEQCSQFFEDGSLGYSPSDTAGEYDGMELRTINWKVEPLSISSVSSSFFDDKEVFPEGSVTFDNALLMTDIDHHWVGRESVCC